MPIGRRYSSTSFRALAREAVAARSETLVIRC
jgi:hypothetical protein